MIGRRREGVDLLRREAGIAPATSAIERIARENNMVEKNLAAAFLTR